MRFRILIPGLVCCALLGQEQSDLFDKAPPAIEKAVRARVALFYQYHTEGKFRAADGLVAEESKDDFFAMEKMKYNGCEVGRVSFSDEFKKAIAVTACKYTWTFNGSRVPAVMPITSYWKLINGDWYWYTPPQGGAVQTPFGEMHSSSAEPAKPVIPANPGALAGGILNSVKADRNAVDIVPGKGAQEQVRIVNSMPGQVRLRLDFTPVGALTARLDKNVLNSNETAVLSIEYEPKPGMPQVDSVARVSVDPTGQVIPVKIHFQAAPAAAR